MNVALNYVLVTGTFDDGGGNPVSGQAVFTPSTTVYAAGVPVLSVAIPIICPIVGGTLESPTGGTGVNLLATDNSGLTFPGLTGFFFWTVQVTIGATSPSQAPWSFFLPHSPSTVSLYSLANTAASGGFTNPMTTAGDMIDATTGGTAQRLAIGTSGQVLTVSGGAPAWAPGLPLSTLGDTLYENATPAAARLAGNTSATKNFLTQTGNGTISAAPAWGTIATSDLASAFPVTFTFGSSGAAPSAGTFTTGQVVTDQNGVVRVCLAGGTPGTWTRINQQPWQFYAEDYGAKGDGQVVGDAAITGGLSSLSSATANFTAADTGKTFVLNGGQGAAAQPLIGTLTFVNATTCTTSLTAGATVTAGVLFWASDDGTALLNMAQAMNTYALAHNFEAEAILNRVYGAKTLYQTTSGPGVYNTHLPVFGPNVNGTTRQVQWLITGPGANGSPDYFDSIVPNIGPGSVVSMVNAPASADGTFGQQSIIGGPTGGGAFTGGFINTHVTTRGIAVFAPGYPNQHGHDYAFCAGWSWWETGAKALMAPASNSPKYPDLPTQAGFQNKIGAGFRAPLVGNNDSITGVRLCVEGYETAGWVQDHFTCHGLATIYSDLALLIDLTHGASGLSHQVIIKNWSCEVYNGAAKCNGGGTNYCVVDIDLDSETVGGADPSYHVNDNGNLHGVFRVGDPGSTSKNAIVSNGAPNLDVQNDMIARGHMASPPSVPGSTSASVPVYRRAAVTVHTGGGVTVSAIAINGTATGLTMVAGSTLALPLVPSGGTVTLTYAGGTPSWDWWLD